MNLKFKIGYCVFAWVKFDICEYSKCASGRVEDTPWYKEYTGLVLAAKAFDIAFLILAVFVPFFKGLYLIAFHRKNLRYLYLRILPKVGEKESSASATRVAATPCGGSKGTRLHRS